MELNILLDQLIPASHISLPHLKNRHFLVGLVDVDEDGGASLFGSRIGFRLCDRRLRLGSDGRRIGLCARGNRIRASFWGRRIGVGRPTL